MTIFLLIIIKYIYLSKDLKNLHLYVLLIFEWFSLLNLLILQVDMKVLMDQLHYLFLLYNHLYLIMIYMNYIVLLKAVKLLDYNIFQYQHLNLENPLNLHPII